MPEMITCPHCKKQFGIPFVCFRESCGWRGIEAHIETIKTHSEPPECRIYTCPKCRAGVGTDWEALGIKT